MNIEEIQEIKTLIGCLDIDDIEPVNKYTANVLRKIINQYEQLQQENKILKENAENNDKAVDKVNWENQLLKKENRQLKEQLLIAQTNEETFRLEMEDITKTLGLDENTLFDDVKAYARNLKDNWNKLREIAKSQSGFKKRADLKGGLWFEVDDLLDKMQEMEKNYGDVENNT